VPWIILEELPCPSFTVQSAVGLSQLIAEPPSLRLILVKTDHLQDGFKYAHSLFSPVKTALSFPSHRHPEDTTFILRFDQSAFTPLRITLRDYGLLVDEGKSAPSHTVRRGAASLPWWASFPFPACPPAGKALGREENAFLWWILEARAIALPLLPALAFF